MRESKKRDYGGILATFRPVKLVKFESEREKKKGNEEDDCIQRRRK